MVDGEIAFFYETLAGNAISGSADITERDCRTFSVSYRLRCPLSLWQLPRQGSQDAGGDFAGDMFHVKHDSDEKSTSVLSPPTGEN